MLIKNMCGLLYKIITPSWVKIEIKKTCRFLMIISKPASVLGTLVLRQPVVKGLSLMFYYGYQRTTAKLKVMFVSSPEFHLVPLASSLHQTCLL